MIYRFADCALDTQLYALHREGQSTRLPPKVFEVLCYLIEHRDRVVSKQELCDQVWEGLAISDATLESCLRAVRITVGDSGQVQRLIQTHRGHGYRFVADVTVETSRSETEERPPSPPVSLEPLEDPVAALSPSQPVLPPPPIPRSVVRLCASCQHANNENAFFCAACGIRLRQLCVHCGQDVILPAAFCTACGQPLAAPSPSNPAPTPTGQAEHKPVTVLCCAVATTTAQGTRIDLDALHSLLLALHAVAHDVVGQYGGRLHPVMGERLMAMFGVPVAHEDDARRAVRVALELRRRLAVRQGNLGTAPMASQALRMGLHTGLVVVGGMRNGDDAEAAATVVGDVVSVATALEERAAPGTILCSDAIARLIQGTARLERQGPLQVSGQPASVETYTVLGRSFRRSPMERHHGRVLSPFVGREREMTTLHALLAQVEAGRGQVVGVVGEPGLGKSRLVYEFRHSLGRRRLTYRSGRCLSYGSTTPYLPVLDLMRHHCSITDTDGPEDITAKIHRSLREVDMAPEAWAPVLLHLLSVQEGTNALAAFSSEARKARILTALTQMCLQGSRQRPLILEIEDLHWIDASSDECLTALVERMAGTPLLVLVTYRPGYRPAWIDKSYVTQVALQPLTSQHSLQVVQAVFPTVALTAPLVPQLLAKADGNPFFLEELAQMAVEQSADKLLHDVPRTIQAVLTARIDRLPVEEKRLLQVAAVIGKDVPLLLLETVASLPVATMQQSLQVLQMGEFLYEARTLPTPVYTFKHILTQEVAYQSLLQRARQPYHQQIAQVLAERFPETAATQPEWLAAHYTEAGLLAEAIPWWEQAGKRAVERSANVEAISHFTKGLELLKTLPVTPARTEQELAFHLALGAPLLMLKGQADPAVEDTYNRALALCQQVGDRLQHFSALAGLWRYYITCGRFYKARELGEQGLELAQSAPDPALLQEAHMMLGSILLYMGELHAAREHLEHGAAPYDLARLRSLTFSRATNLQVLCLSRLAWALWLLGYPESALARVREALTLAQQSSHLYSIVFARFYASMIHQCRREAQATQEHSEAVMALSSEHGFVMWSAEGLCMHGWALAQETRVAEGIEQMRQGLATLEAMGVEIGHSSLLMMLAEVYWTSGQSAAGLHTLAASHALMHKNAEGYYAAELARLTGELLLQESQGQKTVDAEQYFQQARALARRQHARSFELRATMSLSRLWQRQGKRDAARYILAESYSWFAEGHETKDLQKAKALLEALQ